MDLIGSLVLTVILIAISFMILHAVVRSAVTQAMQRHTVWLEDRAIQPVDTPSVDSQAYGAPWPLVVRGTTYTVRQQSTDLWAVELDGKRTHTVMRDERGFLSEGSTRHFGTLEEVVRAGSLY